MQLSLRNARTQTRTPGALPRALTVTLGLSGAGAIIGGTIVTGSWFAFIVGLSWEGYFGPLPFPSRSVAIGTALGAIALPLAAWALPGTSLGRIIAVTGVGTLLGAPIGLLSTLDLSGAVVGAVVGFACGGTWLALRPRGASGASPRRLGIS